MGVSRKTKHVDRVRALFDSALERPPVARSAYLAVACRGDSELRLEVEGLLKALDDEDPNVRGLLEGLPLAPYPDAEGRIDGAEPTPDLLIGRTVSHYHILERLGIGGMGIVYKARDERLGPLVALKFLPPHLNSDGAAKARLLHEARAASALDHHHIATVHEIGEAESGQLFIAMAYYEGETLKDKLAAGRLPPSAVFRYTLQLAEGLAHAHKAGIVHRDIKPSNILITKYDTVKLLDFGVAKVADQSTLTAPGATPGTVAYMSPEQTHGEKLDARSDVWSLGIVTYEMLTGQRPFQGDNADVLIYGIRNDEPKGLEVVCPNTPRLLSDAVRRMLAKDPLERYESAEAVVRDLRSRSTRWRSTTTRFVGPVSIALLPMASLTTDPEQEWFTDGMTDALITDLAKIGGLRVISRASAMHYRDTPLTPPEIAAELGVDYLIEGSVAKLGDAVKISARLIHGARDEYLWAESYDRPFRDVLGLQAEIARAIAQKIRVELTPQEERLLAVDRTVAPETHELYLKGMYHINRYTPDSIQLGLKYLHRAVANDPNEPLAHAGLANGYGLLAHTPAPPPGVYQKSREAALAALALDENQAEAHQALAMIKMFSDWDREGAIASITHALELNPSLSMSHGMYGWFLELHGQVDEAFSEFQVAEKLAPLEPLFSSWLSEAYYIGDHPDEAADEAEKALELNPDLPIALHALGWALAGQGRIVEAIDVHKRVYEISPDYRWCLGETYALAGKRDAALEIAAEHEAKPKVWDSYGLAHIYHALGDVNKVFHWLEDGYRQRHPYILWFRRPGNFGSLSGDPRFRYLASRLGLPD